MKRHASVAAVCAALVLAIPAAILSTAAQSASRSARPAASAQKDLELGEVVVSGKRTKPVRNPQVIIDWLRRLVGQFRYQGYVELHGSDGAPLGREDVAGKGECLAFGLAPGVQCTIKVEWPEVEGDDGQAVPGGISSLNPAMILYGLDPDKLGIHFLQVDNKGVADGGVGLLTGDTLTNSDQCVGVAGDCRRTTRITARPDGKLVQMQTDIVQDGQLVARYLFVMRPIMVFKDDATP
jgi:hypothetical protein